MSQDRFEEKILIVDDEPSVLEVMDDMLSSMGLHSVQATNGAEGLVKLQENKVFMIISDYRMPEMDGLEFCRQVRRTHTSLPFIIASGFADRAALLSGVRVGVSDFFDKPPDMKKFEELVQSYVQKRQDQIKQETFEVETIRNLFIEEAHSILSNLEDSILIIEGNPSDKVEINKVFRKIHTLKGSAASVAGGQTTAELSHAFENMLSSLKDGAIDPDKSAVDLMLSALDVLKHCIDAIEHKGPHPEVKQLIQSFNAVVSGTSLPKPRSASVPGVGAVVVKKEEVDEGVNVSNEKLDRFMEMAGELVAFKNIFYGFVKQRTENQTNDDGLLDMNKALSKLTDELQNQIMDIRKVSLLKAFAKFPRMVRGIAQDLKKAVKYETDGLELQVDKTIAKSLASSLVHVVRNACDHGIETKEKRRSKGKDETGYIRLSASQTGDLITLRVEDDGAGLDRNRIYSIASSKGLVTQESERMTDNEVFELLFIPGFSTAEVVSDLSGRGVGMDVVKTAVMSLGGNVRFESIKDKGTTLTINIPVPKSIMVEQSMVAVSSQILIAVPLSCISEIKPVRDIDFTYIKPFWMIEHNGKSIPIASYEQLINPHQMDRHKIDIAENEMVVVIVHKDMHVALRIDEIKDQLEAVVRPFDRITQVIPGFKGTCHLPGDELAYMVSSEDFIKLVTQHSQNQKVSQAA